MEYHLKERMVSLLTLGVGLSILGIVGVNLGKANSQLVEVCVPSEGPRVKLRLMK